MRFSELTQEEIFKKVNEGYQFTPDEISVEEAISLFDKLPNGTIFKSYHLLGKVIPVEYLDSKEFVMGIIPKRYPVTYESLLAYASPKLKNDREVVSFAIQCHGARAVSALATSFSSIRMQDQTELEQARDNPDLIVEKSTNRSFGDNYTIKSKLLEDEEFVSAEIDKTLCEDGDQYIADEFMMHSKVCVSSMDLASKCVAIYPYSVTRADISLQEDKELYIKALTIAIDNGLYVNAWKILKKLDIQDEKLFGKLDKLTLKLAHLPNTAKIRKAMYEKALRRCVDKMMESLPEKGQLLRVEENENNTDTFDTFEDENE